MSLCPGTLTLHADSGQVEQIIMNLCVNARDAMPQGGIIVVSTEARNAAESPLPLISSNATAGRYAAITVKDSGGGIPQAIQDHIFEPFFTTKGQEGTGLGLSVIYGIVQDHQGGIRLESTPEQGTTFRIFLPATAAEPTAPVPETTRPDKMQSLPRGTGQHVLLVEDEALVRISTKASLQAVGYRVVAAAQGYEALTCLEDNPDIALMITDISMPGLDGRDLADAALLLRPDIAVLLTTGHEHGRIRGDGLAVLTKPYLLDELAAVVSRLLKATGRTEQARAIDTSAHHGAAGKAARSGGA